MALSTNLVSLYKLDADSNDSVGSNNGTDTAISYATAGKIGNCATFNGTTSVITVNDAASLRFTDNFTISFWFNLAQDSSYRYFFNKDDFSGGYHGWDIAKTDTNTIRFEVLTGASTAYDIFSNGAIRNSAWQHCACVMESGTLKMYIDGILQTNTQAGSSMTVSTTNMKLGYVNTGSMDESAIHSRALTADEVSQVYNSGRGNAYPLTDTPSLYGGVAYYKLDESSGNATDSIKGLVATNTGTATYTAGKINNALTLNGSSQYLSATLALTGFTAYSVSGWVKRSAINTYHAVVVQTDNVSHNAQFRITDGNKLQFILTTSADTTITGSTNLTSTSTWYHVVATYNGSNLNLYVDGSSDATPVAKTGTINTNDTTLGIGAYITGGLQIPFAGQIDEVAIFNRALSSTEVTALYNSGNGKQYPFSISAYVLSCATGVFTLTGNAVNLSKGYVMTALTGVFNLVGNAVNMTLHGIQWLVQSKNTATIAQQTKNSATPTNQTKNTSTFINETKS